MTNRPKIKIDWQPVDWAIEGIGLVALAALFFLPISYYDVLPESIPRHFDASGTPDGFGSKKMIWTLPGLGLLLYLGLSILNRFPHIFNYPVEITPANAAKNYRAATRMIRSLNAFVVLIFAYLTYQTIQTALGGSSGVGTLFLPIFLLTLSGIIGLGIWGMRYR